MAVTYLLICELLLLCHQHFLLLLVGRQLVLVFFLHFMLRRGLHLYLVCVQALRDGLMLIGLGDHFLRFLVRRGGVVAAVELRLSLLSLGQFSSRRRVFFLGFLDPLLCSGVQFFRLSFRDLFSDGLNFVRLSYLDFFCCYRLFFSGGAHLLHLSDGGFFHYWHWLYRRSSLFNVISHL